MKTQTKNSLMLMLCAFIWGTAFCGPERRLRHGGLFLPQGRSWLAVLVLLPTMAAFDALRKSRARPTAGPRKERSG